MEEPKPKKKSQKEFIITMILLTLISAGSAGYIIYFRIKMKPYQIKYEEGKDADSTEMNSMDADKNAPQNEVK